MTKQTQTHSKDQADIISTTPQQSDIFSTKRVTAPKLEVILYEALPVLDHGFIRVIDYMGDDSSVVQAARVSYGTGTKKVSEDRGLINYLMRHSHTTPFEMCEIKLHIKLPIFVARQWIRHRTANVNEYSARYSVLDKEFYLPDIADISTQSTTNKQCREKDAISRENAMHVLNILREDAEQCYLHYTQLMDGNYGLNSNTENGSELKNTSTGLARELARMNLTLNYYTQWYWKIDLHNLLHFIKLRNHTHAQLEIQRYAEVLANIVKLWVPAVYDAFVNYKVDSLTFSSKEIAIIRKMIRGENWEEEKTKLSKRELDELLSALQLTAE